MHTFRFLFMLLVILISSAASMDINTHIMTSVMSYNIHNELCDKQPRPWDERRSLVAQIIKSRTPELLGLQGATYGQTQWINEEFAAYSHYAPKDGHLQMGLDLCPILYSDEIYTLLDQGTFLIGEAVQKDEEADASSFLNWVKLKYNESDKVLYVLNTRLSPQLDPKAEAVSERIESVIDDVVGTESFFLLGDMQATPESEVISSISDYAMDSFTSSLVSISAQEATSFGWHRSNDGERLDYVFLSKDIPANSYEVLDISLGDEYPSDHLPVYCKVRLN